MRQKTLHHKKARFRHFEPIEKSNIFRHSDLTKNSKSSRKFQVHFKRVAGFTKQTQSVSIDTMAARSLSALTLALLEQFEKTKQKQGELRDFVETLRLKNTRCGLQVLRSYSSVGPSSVT